MEMEMTALWITVTHSPRFAPLLPSTGAQNIMILKLKTCVQDMCVGDICRATVFTTFTSITLIAQVMKSARCQVRTAL